MRVRSDNPADVNVRNGSEADIGRWTKDCYFRALLAKPSAPLIERQG